MTSLAETLPALSAAVPVVGSRMTGLLRTGEHVLRTAEDLLEQIQEKRSTAAELAAKVQQTLGELADTATTRQAALESGVGEAETALDAALSTLAEGHDAVSRAADAAEAARTELHRELAEAGPALGAVEQEMRAGLELLGDTLGAGEGELSAAVQAVVAETEAVRDLLDDQRTQLAADTDALKERLRDFLEQAKEQLASLAKDVEGWQQEHATHLGGETTRLSSGREEMLQQLDGRLDTDLREVLTEGVGEALAALEGLDKAADEAAREVETGRQSVAAYFEALSTAMEPLPAAVTAVQQAASELGLSWD